MKPLVKDSVAGAIPIFQSIFETAQGGFQLDETVIAAGTTIKEGTVIGYDETTRKAKVAKYAVNKNVSAAGDVTYEVYKGHNLAVGMNIKELGGAAQAITLVDKTNPNHDVITVASTCSADAVTAGQLLFVDDDGVSKARGLLMDDVDLATGVDVAVVLRGTVYENRIPPVDATLKALMPNIIYSKSF